MKQVQSVMNVLKNLLGPDGYEHERNSKEYYFRNEHLFMDREYDGVNYPVFIGRVEVENLLINSLPQGSLFSIHCEENSWFSVVFG